MKKPDLTKYKTTSTLYLLILIIAAVALIFGWRCTSSSLSNRSADLHIRTLPSRCVKVSKTTTVYRISDVRWTKKASTLMFYSQHQTVVVEADGKLLYTRSLKPDSILHTTGRNCEMVSVPENTRSILVTLTNCNPDKQVSDPVFYQGDGVHMFRHELLKAGIPMLLGIMNVALGILLLTYWLFVHHWAYVSKSMLYLGILTTDLGASIQGREVLVLAVPSVFTRSTAKSMAPFVTDGQMIVCVAKGIEEATLMTLSEIIEQEIPQANVAVLSGPSHAEEVGKGLPTTCVVSSHQRETAEYLQGIFMSPVFRVYTTPDMLGVELGAALKNVIALAAGTADGLGYGDNTKAALITRGIAEISRLGVKMGARMETFYGLSGIGDLIVTCASVHSRNRKAGYLMGKGYTMEQAMAEVKMIVEGVYSAKAAKELAEKYDVEMPIITEINKVLFEGKSAAEAVIDLMVRDKKVETPMLPWEDGQKTN